MKKVETSRAVKKSPLGASPAGGNDGVVQFAGALENAVPIIISVVPVFDFVVLTHAVTSPASVPFPAKFCRLNVVPVRWRKR